VASQKPTIYWRAIRRSAGKDSDLDVYDMRAKLESALSEVESARESYGEARRALESLLGRYPAAEIEVATAYPILSASPATGVPATLLQRRPDIVAAERQVLAAFRQEEAAKLALLPADRPDRDRGRPHPAAGPPARQPRPVAPGARR
jgi:outer membrane protein TolC